MLVTLAMISKVPLEAGGRPGGLQQASPGRTPGGQLLLPAELHLLLLSLRLAWQSLGLFHMDSTSPCISSGEYHSCNEHPFSL